VDIDNQLYSTPRYDPLSMVEHYGEPVPTRNANTSRNNATPPVAAELSTINNKKFIGETVKVTHGPYKWHIRMVKDATEATARRELLSD